jgi:hypothetical protein
VARYNVMRELWRRQTQDREELGRPPTAEAHALGFPTLSIRCRDLKVEVEKVSQLYDHLIAAKRQCGERVGGLTLEVFTEFLTSRVKQLKQTLASDEVGFVVGVDHGKVKFTARVADSPSDEQG